MSSDGGAGTPRSDPYWPPIQIGAVAQGDNSPLAGIVAIRGICAGEEIFYESPFVEEEEGYTLFRPEMMQDPTAISLILKIKEFAEKCSHLPDGHPDKYPPEARAAMEQANDLGQAFTYRKLSPTDKLKYAALVDRFRNIYAGAPVIISGLVSEAGKQFNGGSGIARSFDEQASRWAVQLPDGQGKLIKIENLKTPGGIWRSNSFSWQDSLCSSPSAVLFEKLSQLNHSCNSNVDKKRLGNNTFAVFATRDISSGEELFIDYGVPRASAEIRRSWLKMKYNFICQCRACAEEVLCTSMNNGMGFDDTGRGGACADDSSEYDAASTVALLADLGRGILAVNRSLRSAASRSSSPARSGQAGESARSAREPQGGASSGDPLVFSQEQLESCSIVPPMENPECKQQ